MALNSLGVGLIFTAQNLASNVISKLSQDFKGLDKTIDIGGKKISASLIGVGVGLAAVAAGAVALAALRGTVKTFEDFEKAIFEVGTLTKGTTKEIEGLKQETRALAVQFGVAPTEAAKTFYQIISAGVTDATARTELFTVANKLAVGGVTDVSTAVLVITDVMDAYGRTADDATDISDVLFTTMRLGKTTIGELAVSFGKVLPFASQAGFSFEEVGAAAAAVIGPVGDTNRAMTGLSAIFRSFVKPSEEAKKAALKFGFTMNTTTTNALGLQGTLDLLKTALDKDREAFAKLFPDAEATKTILPLLSTSAAKFTSNLEAMTKRTGSAQRGFDVMEKTLARTRVKFEAAKEVVVGLIGEAMAPLERIILRVKTSILKAFAAIPQPIIKAMVQLAAMAAAFVAVSGAVLAFVAAKGLLIKVLALAVPAFKGILLLLAPLLIKLALVAAAVGLVFLAFKTDFLGIRTFVMKVVNSVQILAALFSTGRLSGGLLKEFKKMTPGLQNFIIQIFRIGERIKSFFIGLVQGLAPAGALFGQFFEQTARLGAAIFEAFSGVPFIANLMKAMLDSVGGTTGGFEKFGRIAGVVLTTVISVVLDLVNALLQVGIIITKVFRAMNQARQLNFKGAFASLKEVKAESAKLFDIFKGRGIGGLAITPGGVAEPAPPPPPAPGSTPRPATAAGETAAEGTAMIIESQGEQEKTIILQVDGEKMSEVVEKNMRRSSIRRGKSGMLARRGAT